MDNIFITYNKIEIIYFDCSIQKINYIYKLLIRNNFIKNGNRIIKS